MKYDFDELIERRGTSCVKWDECPHDDVIPLWVADMDFKVAPAIQEAVRKRAEHGVFGYTVVEEDYYDAVINWFSRRHQWTIRHEEILYTTGVVPAMSVAIKALTMPGEKVLILSPDYNCFFLSVITVARCWRQLSKGWEILLRWIGTISPLNAPMRRRQSFCSATLITPVDVSGQKPNSHG